jgi:hypothetical protein
MKRPEPNATRPSEVRQADTFVPRLHDAAMYVVAALGMASVWSEGERRAVDLGPFSSSPPRPSTPRYSSSPKHTLIHLAELYQVRRAPTRKNGSSTVGGSEGGSEGYERRHDARSSRTQEGALRKGL